MSQALRWFAAFCIVAIGCYLFWWWQENMERKTIAIPHLSTEAQRNPTLGAELFLQQQGIKTHTVDLLSQGVAELPQTGVIFLPHRPTQSSEQELQPLWNWVARGGVLITTPVSRNRAPEEEDYAEDNAGANISDPLLQPLGIQGLIKGKGTTNTIEIQIPGTAYPLILDRDGADPIRLAPKAIPSDWQDKTGEYIRAYHVGLGKIIVISNTGWLTNDQLQQRDHAEFLLRLAQLTSAKAKQFLIVRTLDMPRWYQLLWAQFPWGLVVLPLLILLAFWRAVVRFGPILPEPNRNQRALLEHIDASARWLWRAPGGSARLLQASRLALRQHLKRRAPELASLPPAELARRLAEQHKTLSERDVDRALNQLPSQDPNDFVSRIRILQYLRKNI